MLENRYIPSLPQEVSDEVRVEITKKFHVLYDFEDKNIKKNIQNCCEGLANLEFPATSTLRGHKRNIENEKKFKVNDKNFVFYWWACENSDSFDDLNHVVLSKSICSMMKIDFITNISRFVERMGDYIAFREGLNANLLLKNRKLIKGDLSLYLKGNVPWFRHTSIQNIDGKDLDFLHEGPVFCSLKKIYLLGFGDTYIRQWTAKNEDGAVSLNPGIVLTERHADEATDVPMAAKSVIIPKVDFEKIDFDSVESFLHNDEAKIDSVLYGWSIKAPD